MFPHRPRRVRFGPTQSQRQKRFARLRRLSLPLLLSALPVTGAGCASFRVRVWAFSAMRGRAKNAHKPFDSLGEKHYG